MNKRKTTEFDTIHRRSLSKRLKTMRLIVLALLFFFVILYSCRDDYSSTAAYDQGHEIYLAHCVSCHGIDGDGNNASYPPLANRTIDENATNRSILLITQGSPLMNPISLENEEIEKVIHYIENSWGLETPTKPLF